MTMKKMIIVLAMALLVAGAAQAQVRKMYVHLNNDSIVKIPAADIQEVTFDMDYAPTTIEEATEILLSSYWKIEGQFDDEFYENFEEAYITIGGDPVVLYWAKVKDTCTNEDYAPYAGKIKLITTFGTIIMRVPTEFIIMGNGLLVFRGTNLQPDSFDLTRIIEPATWHCVRVDPFDQNEIVL